MRYAARKDANQELIVQALRAAGATVHILDAKNLPDLLVGYRGKTLLIEIKDGAKKPSERRLRPGQQRFFDEWRGGPAVKVENLEEALTCLKGSP